jgi:hypothetical protein
VALAEECEFEFAPPWPESEWLVDEAVADAARAVVNVRVSGATGVAANTRAKMLAHRPSRRVTRSKGVFIWVSYRRGSR